MRLDHADRAVPALGLTLRQQVEVLHLRRGEQLRGAVRARGHARAATDARGRVHRRVGDRLRDRDQVAVGRAAGSDADVTARLDDAVERAAVDDEVLDEREARGAPRLDREVVAVVELPHVQLARGGRALGSVRLPVDHEAARTADAFAAVVVERDRFLAVVHQPFVHDVEHLEERHVGAHAGNVVRLELAARRRATAWRHTVSEMRIEALFVVRRSSRTLYL